MADTSNPLNLWYNKFLPSSSKDGAPYNGTGVKILVDDMDTIDKKNTAFIGKSITDTNTSVSKLVEIIDNGFEKRELNHASAVASTIIGAHNIGGTLQNIGSSPNATLYTKYKDFVIDKQQPYDIINASYGYDNAILFQNPILGEYIDKKFNESYEKDILNGRDGKGLVYVKAAGNEGQQTIETTNQSVESITIGGLNKFGKIQDFSNYGANIDVIAPSEQILVTDSDNNKYLNVNGTSFSAPLASGIIANALQANPNLGLDDIKKHLLVSADFPNHNKPTIFHNKNATDLVNGQGIVNSEAGAGIINPDLYRLAETTAQYHLPNDKKKQAIDQTQNINIKEGTTTIELNISDDFEITDVALQPTIIFDQSKNNAEIIRNMTVSLISPSGTKIVMMDGYDVLSNDEMSKEEILLFQNRQDNAGVPNFDYKFGTHHFMGEETKGKWKVVIESRNRKSIDTESFLKNIQLEVKGYNKDTIQSKFITDEAIGDTVMKPKTPLYLNASLTNYGIDYENGILKTKNGKINIQDPSKIKGIFSGSGNDLLVLNDSNQHGLYYPGRGDDFLGDGTGGNIIADTNGNDTYILENRKPTILTGHVSNIGEKTISGNSTNNLLILDQGQHKGSNINLEDLGDKGFQLKLQNGSYIIEKNKQGLPVIDRIIVGTSGQDNGHLIDRTIQPNSGLIFDSAQKKFVPIASDIMKKYNDNFIISNHQETIQSKINNFIPNISTSFSVYKPSIDTAFQNELKADLNKIAHKVESEHGGVLKSVGDFIYKVPAVGHIMGWLGYQSLDEIGQGEAKKYMENMATLKTKEYQYNLSNLQSTYNHVAAQKNNILAQNPQTPNIGFNIVDLNKNQAIEPSEVSFYSDTPLAEEQVMSLRTDIIQSLSKSVNPYIDLAKASKNQLYTTHQLQSKVSNLHIDKGQFLP